MSVYILFIIKKYIIYLFIYFLDTPGYCGFAPDLSFWFPLKI